MWTLGTTNAEAGLLDQTRRRRRGSLGWLGIFVSIALVIGGVLARVSGGVLALVAGGVLAVSVVLINWTRFWLEESREPFKFTFSVSEFEQRTTVSDSASETMLGWLARDLIANLGNRVPRLSLYEPAEEEYDPDQGPSHVHVTGWYGIRKTATGDRGEAALRWQLEIVPQVRLGGVKAPAKLGQIIRFDLGESNGRRAPALTRDKYNGAFERVYWSVASQIYAQIGQAVKEKIELLPPGALRAAAYLNEADDYADSNTLDAYAAARELYRKARELYDVTAREEPTTKWRRGWRSVREWFAQKAQRLRLFSARASQRAARRELLTARAELGEAQMRISEFHLKPLCGSIPDEIFTVVPLAEQAINRLEQLPHDVGGLEEALFKGKLTLALAKYLLRDEAGAKACLDDARSCHPMLARKDPEYLFIAGLNERARLRSQRLFGQAVELASTIERSRFYRALRSDHIWRSQPTFEAKVARTVDDEYEAVVAIDPGNIAAWANRGYMAWLLATGENKQEWRDRAFISLEAGRQYKEVRHEAIVAELDWNLARLAAETGDFPRAYKHYFDAVSAQLGDTPFPFGDYFYENAGEALADRFRRYRKRVEKKAAAAPATETRLVKAVQAFVLNDCGLAFNAYRFRSGDEKALEWAKDAFEESLALDGSLLLPAFNLARLHYELFGEAQADESEQSSQDQAPGESKPSEEHLLKAAALLEDVLRREPDWAPAQLLMVDVQANLAVGFAQRSRRLAAQEKSATSGQARPGLAASKPADAGESSRDLRSRRAECQKSFVKQLQRMLPHSCFGLEGLRIDESGDHVHRLIDDKTIKWRQDFTEFHVRALIGWARALAIEEETAGAAFRLCRHLRDTYYRADDGLVAAHLIAAYNLKKVVGTEADEGGDGEVPGLDRVVVDCQGLLKDRVNRILTDDPAHHAMLSSSMLTWFDQGERKDLLLKAREADPSPMTMVVIGDRLLNLAATEDARRVLEKAAAQSDSAAAPQALLLLGGIHEQEEAPAKALDAYRRAATSPNPEVAPKATLLAIEILAREQRRGEAAELCKTVASLSPEIALDLGVRLRGTPTWRDEALSVFRIALTENPGDPIVAGAAIQLAELLDMEGEEAESALQIAVAADDAQVQAEAKIALARVLAARGETSEAEELLRSALESSPQESRDLASLFLAQMLHVGGREQEAMPLFEAAVGSADAGTATSAAMELGKILEDSGDREAARRTYLRAAASQSWNALMIAGTLRDRGELEVAEEVCRVGADPKGPEPLFAPDVRLLYADLLAGRGEIKKAEEEYWRVVETRDTGVVPGAAAGLGKVFEQTKRRKIDAYLSVIERTRDLASIMTADMVATLKEEGDAEGVEKVYLAIAATGGFAALQVGGDLEAAQQPALAATAYRLGIREDGPFAAEGMVRLANLIAIHDPGEAERLYRSAIRIGFGEVLSDAEEGLARLPAPSPPGLESPGESSLSRAEA